MANCSVLYSQACFQRKAFLSPQQMLLGTREPSSHTITQKKHINVSKQPSFLEFTLWKEFLALQDGYCQTIFQIGVVAYPCQRKLMMVKKLPFIKVFPTLFFFLINRINRIIVKKILNYEDLFRVQRNQKCFTGSFFWDALGLCTLHSLGLLGCTVEN